ncbi:MAG: S24/S26 family peptidase [Planctomycetota bacterium]|jgi:hypothetical protein
MVRSKCIRVAVGSSSMAPTLRTGETAWVRTDLRHRVGDVVLIRGARGNVVHRLVARFSDGRKTWFVHQGDASRMCGLVEEGEIEGVVPGLWRRPRYPRMLLFLRLAALLRFLGVRLEFVPSGVRRLYRRA